MSLLHIGGSSGASSVVPAEGVDFDGVSDYLSRSTDLVGNVDSKTFTFSCWVYTKNNEATDYLFSNWDGGNGDFYVFITNTGAFSAIGRNTSNTIIFSVTSSILIPLNTWTNILISIDLSSTSLRHLYINDVLDTPTWNTYSNQLIDFTDSSFVVSATVAFASIFEGRLSNLFLDYTYRDLSIEANRRLFITADGKPADWVGQVALNPILALRMKDAATAHINEGTGGNFVQNGTLDTASRGANQDNCVASYFDGSADYLRRTTSIGAVSSKLFTLSCFVASTDNMTAYRVFQAKATYDSIRVSSPYLNSGLTIYLYNSTPALILNVSIPFTSIPSKRNVKVDISFDLSDITKRHAFLDGKEVSAIWNTYTNDNYAIGASTTFYIGCDNGTSLFLPGNLGELYFDTKYIDLATSNPFWDKDTNKPIPVRKVIASTGVTPLIAMPLNASNAGKNYGSGGDFTANSAPYVGARGGSEFWARSAKFGSSASNKLTKTDTVRVDSNTSTIVLAFKPALLSNSDPLIQAGLINVWNDSQARIRVDYIAYGGSIVKSIACSPNKLTIGNWCIALISYNNGTTTLNINGSADNYYNSSVTSKTPCFSYNGGISSIGYLEGDSNYADGDLGFIYISTDYIDFSQEVNRNKFIDQLGYPKDLKAQTDAGVIPKPLIYLPFDDTSNLGKNLGTGGNFTVNGAVTAGADVLG